MVYNGLLSDNKLIYSGLLSDNKLIYSGLLPEEVWACWREGRAGCKTKSGCGNCEKWWLDGGLQPVQVYWAVRAGLVAEYWRRWGRGGGMQR